MIARPAPVLPGVPWVGVNYWSAAGPRTWSRFDAGRVREELAALAEHGLTVTRSFLFWPDAMPKPDFVAPEVLGHYATFLDLSADVGLPTIPTFLVGHMSGENWDPVWRDGRDLYRDPEMLAAQEHYIESVVHHVGDHPAIVAWLVSNEMPLYAGEADHEAVQAWAERCVGAVRGAGASQPVSLGDGAWGVESTGHDNGYRRRELAVLEDFTGPHAYPAEPTRRRHHMATAFACEAAHVAGRPVVLEEFGVSSALVADAPAADLYRQSLHLSYLAGARGWLAWNNTDFDLADEDPYRHRAFERHFGVLRSDGTPKPVLHELAAFARLVTDLDLHRCSRVDTDTVVVVPEAADTVLPFVDEEERTALVAGVAAAVRAARHADLAPALVREADGPIPPGARLVLVPLARQLMGPTWDRLEELASGGATVLVTGFCGVTPVHGGPWIADLDDRFDVVHGLSYGATPRVDGPLVLTFTEPVGHLERGSRLHLGSGDASHACRTIPVEPRGARVLAIADGAPALLERAVGAGRLLLATAPLEHLAAVDDIDVDGPAVLLQAVAQHAGVERTAWSPDPGVVVDAVRHPDGRVLVWVVESAGRRRTVPLRSPLPLRDVGGGPPVGDDVTVDPWGVRILEQVAHDGRSA